MDKYSSIELDIIKKEVADNAFIEDAKLFIINENVSFNPLQIKKNISNTDEALKIINDGYDVSFDGIYSIEEIVYKIEKSITLNGIELNRLLTFYNHSGRIKRLFTRFNKNIGLRDYSDSIMLNDELFNRISKTIDNNGNVKEDASPELKRLLNNQKVNENRLNDKAHSFIKSNLRSLQEEHIYTRDNRVTFLIKNVDKNKFGGFIYGNTASNSASYVEPNSFVELNNEKNRIQGEINDEINRILFDLTYHLGFFVEELRNNYDSLVNLNVIFAKANYGINNNGILGTISNELIINNGCHPLIERRKVVSNTYRLIEPYRGIVISGSNTGGKTVSLKLIGLSVLMTYLGIPIICDSAEIPIYDNVFVDINDNQSVLSSLSTFSSHIVNINSILEDATEKSLILIDELVSGTDPKQAQAISIAIIERLEEIGSQFIITTHYDDVKNKAYKDEKIMLSAVGFNTVTLSPTYKYIENSIGTSNAFDIAARYLRDEKIISRAKDILNENSTKNDDMVTKLNSEIEHYESLSMKTEEQKKELEDLKNQLNEKIDQIEIDKEKIKQEYEAKIAAEFEKAKEKANELIEASKSDSRIVQRVMDMIPTSRNKENKHFRVNDTVRIKDNDTIGNILDINKNIATISFNGLKVKANLSDLTHVRVDSVAKKNNRVKVNKDIYSRSLPHELNIVGKRVENALVELEYYLDSAYANKYSSVRIIHGIGSGALKLAVHDRLGKMKIIQDYKIASAAEGGAAVTIVDFKK